MASKEKTEPKVLLIFPPGWDPRGPYLSLPQLTAYLRQNNIYTKQVDLNIEILNELLTKTQLEKCYDNIESEIASLKNQKTDEENYNKLEELLICRNLYNAIKSEFEENLKLLKSDFVLPEQYVKARKTVEIALRIYSAGYYPWRIQDGCLYQLKQVPNFYEVSENEIEFQRTISDIEKVLNQHPTNPYSKPIETYLDNIFSKENFDITGLSVCSYSQLIPALTIAKYVKTKTNSITVMGGAIIQFMVSALKRNHYLFDMIDVFVNGEGETPLLNLANSYTNSDFEYSKVSGIIFKDRETGRVCETELAPPININEVPTPDFDDFDLGKYFISPNTMSLPIMITRGCYWNKCSFCSLNANFHFLYRQRPIDMVLKDLDLLNSKYGVKYFRFNDNAISPSLLNSMSTAILNHGQKYKWMCLCRLESKFEKSLWEKAYLSGLRFVTFGIESSSQTMLNQMNKGVDAYTISKNLRECHDSGIFVHAFIMYGHPGEDESEYEKNSAFIRQNEAFVDSIVLARFRVDIDTPIYKDPEKYGIRINKEKLPKDYIWFTCDYEEIDGKKVYNQDLEFKLRDSISDLLCFIQTSQGLDDTYIFNLIFEKKNMLLRDWGREWIDKYANLKKILTTKQALQLSPDAIEMNGGQRKLIYNKESSKYWIFPNKDFDIGRFVYNKNQYENDISILVLVCDIILDGALGVHSLHRDLKSQSRAAPKEKSYRTEGTIL